MFVLSFILWKWSSCLVWQNPALSGHPVNMHTLLFHFILTQPNAHSATYNIDRFFWPISDQMFRFQCHFLGKVIEKNFFGSTLCKQLDPFSHKICCYLLKLLQVSYNCCWFNSLLRSERSERSSSYNLAYKAIKAEKILISSVLHFVPQSLAFYSLPQCLGALEAHGSGLCAASWSVWVEILYNLFHYFIERSFLWY